MGYSLRLNLGKLKMKNVFVLWLAVLLLAGLFMTACGGEKNDLTKGMQRTVEEEMDDFLITITVSSDKMQQGQDIDAVTVFKNQSGERHNIGRGVYMTVPIVIDSEHYQGITPLPAPTLDILEIDGVITDTWQIGSLLPKGKHQLVVRAAFDLYEIEDEKIIAAQPVLIESKPIILTVY